MAENEDYLEPTSQIFIHMIIGNIREEKGEKVSKLEKLSIKALANRARFTNSDSYNTWHSRWAMSALESTLEEYSDLDAAGTIYRYFWLDFKCVSLKSNQWQYWNMTDQTFSSGNVDLELKRAIENNFVPLLRNIKSNLDASLRRISREKEREELEKRLSNLTKFIKSLKNAAPRAKILKLLREYFYE